MAGIQKHPDCDAFNVVRNTVERRNDGGEPQITRREIDRRLRLLHRGLLIDRQIRIAPELG